MSLAQIDISELDQFYNSDFKPKELNENSVSRINRLFEYYSSQADIKGLNSKKEYEDFVYRSNYFLEKLNKSGEVFYGDEISQYLNDLKDFLLEGNERKNDIRVYLTRQPVFNAFTNDFGNIYFNVAVVSKLENEEQLLAVLAHEICHILFRHTHKFEEFQKEIENDGWKSRDEDNVLVQHAFSREQEFEADKEAFLLLEKRGVNLVKALSIFNSLQYDLDPHLNSIIQSHNFSFGNEVVKEIYAQQLSTIDKKWQLIEEFEFDSLRTHPSTLDRLNEISKLIEGKSTDSHNPIGDFHHFSLLAKYVMIKSYIEQSQYVEGLSHVLKLRNEFPNDQYLIKSQAKLLLLLTQAKYNGTPFDLFLNDKGAAFTDTAFIEFKEAVLAFNATEFNMLSLLVVKEMKKEVEISYLDRLHAYLIKFLYKYNQDLFTFSNGNLDLITELEVSSDAYNVNTLDPYYNLTQKSIEGYLELKEKGYVEVQINNQDSALSLLRAVVKIGLTDLDRNSINSYKQLRRMYEHMLTADNAFITFNPEVSYDLYKNGAYTKNKYFESLDSIALVQSTSVFLKKSHGGYRLDPKRSLELERDIDQILSEMDHLNKSFSNTSIAQMEMKDINNHYSLMLWMNERFMFNDLVYSVVDEEMMQFKEQSDIKHILFNINVTALGSGLIKKKYTYGYNIYYNLAAEGIPYVSKIATKYKGNSQIFRQLFYLSDYYRKE